MKKEFVIRKCMKCGAMIEVIKDCTCDNCGVKCCGEQMQKVEPNTVEASIEKHLPQVEIIGSYIVVTVPHVMEENHYIEWIAMDSKQTTGKKFFEAGQVAKAVFPYIPNSTIYASCNLHGLWSIDVK